MYHPYKNGLLEWLPVVVLGPITNGFPAGSVFQLLDGKVRDWLVGNAEVLVWNPFSGDVPFSPTPEPFPFHANPNDWSVCLDCPDKNGFAIAPSAAPHGLDTELVKGFEVPGPALEGALLLSEGKPEELNPPGCGDVPKADQDGAGGDAWLQSGWAPLWVELGSEFCDFIRQSKSLRAA